jgi:hypothetical protein
MDGVGRAWQLLGAAVLESQACSELQVFEEEHGFNKFGGCIDTQQE